MPSGIEPADDIGNMDGHRTLIEVQDFPAARLHQTVAPFDDGRTDDVVVAVEVTLLGPD